MKKKYSIYSKINAQTIDNNIILFIKEKTTLKLNPNIGKKIDLIFINNISIKESKNKSW